MIQTRTPGHHAVRHASTHDFLSFAVEELALRDSPPYPPTLRLANLIVSGLDEVGVATFAGEVARWCLAAVSRFQLGVTVLGPAPCPVDRIKTRWRWHVILKSSQVAPLTRLLRGLADGVEVPAAGGLRLAIDRDPVALL